MTEARGTPTQDVPLERWLSIDGVCQMIGISRPTFQRYKLGDELPSLKLGDGRIKRFREADVRAWIESRMTGAAP